MIEYILATNYIKDKEDLGLQIPWDSDVLVYHVS